MANKRTKKITEELTSSGEGSGIEREIPTTSGEPVASPGLDPEKIDLHTRTMTIDQLLSRIRDNAVELIPDFQRRIGVWDDARQSRLIESLLLKIPMPPLYAAEDADENWVIVDGVHRLRAILRFVDAAIIGGTPLVLEGLEYLGADFVGKPFKAVSPRLQRRLKETELVIHVVRHGTPDREKFNIFSRIATAAAPPSAQEIRHALTDGPARGILTEWSQCKEFIRATGDSIRDERMAARELVLRFAAFRLWPPTEYAEENFDLFLCRAMEELNGLALEAEAEPEPDETATEPESGVLPEQEPEDIDDLPGEAGDGPATAALETVEPDKEEEPEELEEPEPPAESAADRLSRMEAEFKAAMDAAFAIFGENAFRKASEDGEMRHPVNRALFETVSVGLADLGEDERKQIVARKGALTESFTELLQNKAFDAAISQTAGDPDRVRKRFAEFAKLLKKALE